MTINCLWADTKRIGNLLVALPARKALQHFQFTFGKLLALLGFINNFLCFRRYNPFATDDFRNTQNNLFWRRIFDKQSINTGIGQPRKKTSCRYASNNRKTRCRGPTLSFNKHLQAIRPWHTEVKQGAVRFKPLDHCNGFNSIGRNADHLKFLNRIDFGLHAFRGKRMIIGNDNGFRHIPPWPVFRTITDIPLLLLLALLGNLFLTVPVYADDAVNRVVSADGPMSMNDLAGHVDYFLDPSWQKTVGDMYRPGAAQFKPVNRTEPDFGYTKDKIWLRFKVKNTTVSEDEWRLHFRENFKQVIDVYLVREDGRIDHALKLNQDSGFDKRPVAFPEMVVPMHIEPGETITVFVAYWSEGSSHLAFNLETADSFSDAAISQMAKNFIYYGMMIILIIAAFISMLILKENVFPAYIAYAVSTLLFLMHADGVAFEYLWPAFPSFNSIASIVTGGALAATSLNYARVFLQTKIYNPIMDKILLGMIILVVAIGLSTILVDPQIIKKTLIPVALLSLGLCLLSGLVAARTRFREVRFYVLAWTGAVISSMIMNLRHIAGVTLTQDLEFDSMRVAMVFDAAMMGLAIADRYNQMRQARQRAMQKSLDEAERNLQLNTRLQELEQQYQLAAEMAQSRDRDMQNTVHDIRQPLHALRLNVKNLLKNGREATSNGENIEETFSYLEGLIADQLRNSIARTYSEEMPSHSNKESHLTIPRVLESIYEMFLPDAKQKGLEFKFEPSEHDAHIEPLILMRIITNLVSNAIKYTEQGEIGLSSTKTKNALEIEVHDTGPGMSQPQFEKAKLRKVRLNGGKDHKDGSGYGLAIVEKLAVENGLKVYLSRRRQNGTGIILKIQS